MTTGKGKLLNNENFTGMIENLGDAYEAAEECHGMIWYLAAELAATLSRDGLQEPVRQDSLDLIEDAQIHYKEGLELGGVQRPR
jgi:hypothetical protein